MLNLKSLLNEKKSTLKATTIEKDSSAPVFISMIDNAKDELNYYNTVLDINMVGVLFFSFVIYSL